jgi:hypothetical protein
LAITGLPVIGLVIGLPCETLADTGETFFADTDLAATFAAAGFDAGFFSSGLVTCFFAAIVAGDFVDGLAALDALAVFTGVGLLIGFAFGVGFAFFFDDLATGTPYSFQ